MTEELLRVAFDPGSSLTKVVYQIGQNKPKFLFMDPEVFAIPRESINTKTTGDGAVGVKTPINDAWLSYGKKDEQVYTVGYLAQQFKAQVRLGRLKFESALPKFLATIAAIASQENLDRTRIKVNAALLLPYGEFKNRQQLEEQIKNQSKSFYFRGELVKAFIQHIITVPEGGGFIAELKNRRGADWLARQDAVCVLMLGHRNASLLTFTKGMLNSEKCKTIDQGFAALVDRAVSRTSGQNRNSLTRTIYEVGDKITADRQLIRASTKSTEESNINAEAEILAQAIGIARKEYWLFLKDWIDDLLPKRVNDLIICGGGAFYLKPELSEFLQWAKPRWQGVESERIQSLLADWSDPSLLQRIGDVWAMFENSFLIEV